MVLDTKINTEDNEKKWITTWNNYLTRLKLFFRWLYNARGKDSEDIASQSDWETPSFARIKTKKSKRVSPYSETELWERDEILFTVRYEPHKRNKAALTLFWDQFNDGYDAGFNSTCIAAHKDSTWGCPARLSRPLLPYLLVFVYHFLLLLLVVQGWVTLYQLSYTWSNLFDIKDHPAQFVT
ncbi:MAG: hypothetical protein WA323_04580 [Candidatus Nitrosopolaris sp.]